MTTSASKPSSRGARDRTEWLELVYVRPYWPVLLADYGRYIGAHSSLALVTFGAGADRNTRPRADAPETAPVLAPLAAVAPPSGAERSKRFPRHTPVFTCTMMTVFTDTREQ